MGTKTFLVGVAPILLLALVALAIIGTNSYWKRRRAAEAQALALASLAAAELALDLFTGALRQAGFDTRNYEYTAERGLDGELICRATQAIASDRRQVVAQGEYFHTGHILMEELRKPDGTEVESFWFPTEPPWSSD